MMHRDAEVVETVVIDEDLIKASYEDERNYEKKGDSVESKREPLSMQEIMQEAHTLRLSFKNIFKIDNLQGFEGLRMLCLDNNIIEDVQNLGHLTNLEWLDLSFNNITNIEGLEQLTKLTDLSLFNNNITELKGLDNCSALNCLSIGNNDIKATDQLMYLRGFKTLRLVNLEGNPVCADPEYRMFVLAYIDGLKYLDYAMVQQSEVEAAREQYQDELLEIEEKEGIKDAALERDRAKEKQSQQLESANMSVVETLFDDMFKEDSEMSKLRLLPGITELLENYRESFNSISESFKASGLERSGEREAELSGFLEALDEMRVKGEQESVVLIQDFNKEKKKAFRELSKREHVEFADLDALRRLTGGLGNSLMDLEMQQVEQFDDLINEFEVAFGEMKNGSLDSQQTYFRSVEELEDAYFEALTQLATELLDKAQNDMLPDDVTEEAKNLLADRDMTMNAVAGSHDIHVGKLLSREEEMRTREMEVFNGAVARERETENKRNRSRGMEVHQLLERNHKEMMELVTEEHLDEDYGGDDGM